MDGVCHLRRLLLKYVRDIEAQPAHFAGQHAASAASARQLAEQLATEYDLRAPKALAVRTVRQQQMKVNRLQAKLRSVREEVALLKGSKIAGKVQLVWYLRTVFSPSTMSMQALSSWCRDFAVEEDSVLSKTTIAKAKDAFAEILKTLSATAISHAAVGQGKQEDTNVSKPFFFRHIHDEACMKLRSYNREISAEGRILRGKYSKIQNNVCELICQQGCLEYFMDFQCLLRKDAPSIAHCICKAAGGILDALCSGESRQWDELRFIHCLTGDGIATNANAARRVLHHFQSLGNWSGIPLQYFLVCCRCATHAASLVVQVGIVGELKCDPVNTCDLTAACSRWFKYILPSNIEEVHVSLRRFLHGNIQTILSAEWPQSLQDLYGNEVLPDGLLGKY